LVCAVEAVPYDKIKAQFKKGERVSIVTCNTCTRSQEAGGAKLMEEISQKLVQDVGIEVVEEIVLSWRRLCLQLDAISIITTMQNQPTMSIRYFVWAVGRVGA